jgi:hypothetical protein
LSEIAEDLMGCEIIEFSCVGVATLNQCRYATACNGYLGCNFTGRCEHKRPEISISSENRDYPKCSEEIIDLNNNGYEWSKKTIIEVLKKYFA